MGWLVPWRCTHVLCRYAYSHCLACASLMCAYAMRVCLLSWLGSCRADVCLCYACVLTVLAWLMPRRCVHVSCMYAYSPCLALALPICAYAMNVCCASVMWCLACICLAEVWLMPRLLYLMPRMHLLGWMPRLLKLMPRMYLLGCGLADALFSILDASHVLAWQWLG